MSAAARTDGARRRILDDKRSRGAAQTGAQALITQYRSMKASEGLPRRVRRGMRTRDRLAAMRFAVDDFDMLAGRPLFSLDYLPVAMGGTMPDVEHQEAETFWRQSAPEPGQSGHCELDRSRAFELGLDTLRKSIEGQAAGSQGSTQETYQAFALAVAGLFERKSLDFQALRTVLAENFVGNEPLRLHFLNAHPKYGNADATVDALVGVVVERIKHECARHKMAPQESHFVPGAFCWIMHEQLGRACGATPDGRKAGFPFADGGGPAQGCERNGPTSAILSTTSWDHAPLIGGVAYNMKFNSTLFDSPASVKGLEDLLVTYLRRGGFEVQVNVLDPDTLAKARENPEQFCDLVVRIGGYTDYFTRLSPQMQEEVMKRTEFGNL
jgi:hypothetical protein